MKDLKEEEKMYWFGKRKGKEIYKFKGLDENPVEILMSLREGKVPPLEENQDTSGIPDLREIAIEFARRRVEAEFNREQKLIKFQSLKIEIDRILNLYYEKLIGFGIFFSIDPVSMDPCRLFREDAPEGDTSGMLSGILKEGKNLCDLRARLNEFVKKEIRVILPNASEIAGEDICAEMLRIAGSVKRLGSFPSSTIQVLGAEKALFKHVSSGTPPPKHGLIFKFPGITALPKKKRGKASRMIANKIAICLRADAVGRRMDLEPMKEEIRKKMEAIKNQ